MKEAGSAWALQQPPPLLAKLGNVPGPLPTLLLLQLQPCLPRLSLSLHPCPKIPTLFESGSRPAVSPTYSYLPPTLHHSATLTGQTLSAAC